MLGGCWTALWQSAGCCKGLYSWPAAAIEPLEGTVRAVKGQKLFNQEY